MKTYLLQLIDFDYWANTCILRALQSLTFNQRDAEVEKAMSLLNHIVNVQAIWLKRIEASLGQSGCPPESLNPVPGLWEVRELGEEHQLLKENRERFVATVEKLPHMNTPVNYSNSKGAVFTNQLADLLLHLSHHGHYHRGQINHLLRKMGAVPPLIDYIHYLRQQA